MNILKANIKILNNNGLLSKLITEKFILEYNSKKTEIITACNNYKTLKYNETYLYSRHNPKKTAIFRLKKVLTKISTSKVNVILGFGLGYEIKEILSEAPNSSKFVIIATPEIFFNVIKELNLSEIFDDDRLLRIYLTLPEEVELAFSEMMFLLFEDQTNILNLDIPFESNECFKFYNSVLRRAILHRNTFLINGKNFLKNSLLNLPKFIKFPGVQDFFEKFNYPVIIASGGPSLSNDLFHLKKLQNRAIIVAVSAAVKPLLKNGIIPDFAAYIDASEKQYEYYFKGINKWPEDTILILKPYVNWKIGKEAKRIIISNVTPGSYILNLIKPFFIDKGTVLDGLSVAHFAFDFGAKITSGPIILVGQDLSYPLKGFTHIEGSGNEEIIEITEENKDKYIWIKGNYQKLVPTTPSLKSFLDVFVLLARLYKDRILINATSEGAYIEGFQVSSLDSNYVKELLPSYDISKEKDDMKNLIYNYRKTSIVPESIIKKTREIVENTEYIYRILNENIHKKAKDRFNPLLNLVNEHKELMYAIMEYAGVLFNFHALYGAFINKKISIEESIDKFSKIYEGMHKAAKEFLNYWRKLISNLESHNKKPNEDLENHGILE